MSTYVVHVQLKCYFSIFFVMEPYCMTIYGDCWRQRWIAIINCFCLFLEHKNWFCWKVVLSGSGKFWSRRIIMVKLIEKQLYNDTTFVIWLSQSRKVSTVSGWPSEVETEKWLAILLIRVWTNLDLVSTFCTRR